MSEQRAALVERMAQTIRSAWIDWEIDDTAGGKTYAAVAAEAALAAVEAAGWRPRPEAVTAGDIHQALGRVQSTPSIDWLRDYITSEILATLRSRGITVEGRDGNGLLS